MTDPPIDSGAPQSVHASGDRSIALGGSAIASLLVTGDNNTFFVGRWHRLADAYLNPRRLYAELDAEGFVGREWLASRVDAFISGNDRGYLIVEGDAGVGKSSFLAWLARSRGYTHHFVRLMPDAGDLAVAVRNISTQLIRAWELTEKAVGGVLPPNGDTPAFLDEVIDAAAQARDRIAPDEPIVIVVDGLDESVVPEGGNPLGLPVLLPRHVYLIASQRPVHVPLHVEVPRAVIEIVAGSE